MPGGLRAVIDLPSTRNVGVDVEGATADHKVAGRAGVLVVGRAPARRAEITVHELGRLVDLGGGVGEDGDVTAGDTHHGEEDPAMRLAAVGAVAVVQPLDRLADLVSEALAVAATGQFCLVTHG